MNFARNEIISKFYLDEFNNLKNIIQKKLGSNYESHIEDIVQTSFLKILKTNFFHDSKKGNLKSWIYIVTYNTAMEYIRRKQTKPFIHEAYDFNIPTDSIDNPLTQLIHKESIDNLELKINNLNDLERHLVKNYMNGNFQKDTARELGISHSYAKWKLFMAKKKLK